MKEKSRKRTFLISLDGVGRGSNALKIGCWIIKDNMNTLNFLLDQVNSRLVLLCKMLFTIQLSLLVLSYPARWRNM